MNPSKTLVSVVGLGHSNTPVMADVCDSCSVRMGYPRYPRCSKQRWMSRYADSLCETAATTPGRQCEANVHSSAGRRHDALFKALGGGGRHVRPLTAVAHVGDVALLRGGDSGVDLGAPRHVGTHAEKVLQLGRRQSRVFVLGQRK